MASGLALLAYITLQRVVELAIAQRNTRALVARGAYESGGDHYPVMVALHASWLATLWLFGWNETVRAVPLALFVVLQAGRFWVLATLGARWTTRIIIVPNERPVRSGPYRFVRHPNYVVVALELPCASLALGLTVHAVVFGALNLAMLGWRIRAENRAFATAVRS